MAAAVGEYRRVERIGGQSSGAAVTVIRLSGLRLFL